MRKLIWASMTIAAFCLVAFSLSQDYQNFRFRIGRLILDLSDSGSAKVNIDDYGLGYVIFNEYSLGRSGSISFSRPFGEGKGIFSIYACVDGWEESEGYASIDAFMKTTFRFIFNKPDPEILPEEASLPESVGFVLFLEGRANAWAHGPLPSFSSGYATASGSFSTEIVSASASIDAFFPNPYFPFDVYDYDPEPQQGYRRGAVIKSVEISSGQGDYELRFSGLASTLNFNAMSVGNAYARTGIVVLSGVDPLGVPEVGDNEFVYEERYEEDDVRLLIPVSASIIAGFEPTEDLLQWFSSKLDWKASPRIDCGPVDFLTRLTNGYRGNKIFPRFEDYELVYVEQPGAFPVQIVVVREGLAYGGETLPLDNSDFGRRQIILTFNGQDVHAANIETFFPAKGYRHPDGGPPGYLYWWGIPSTTPNYIYYYSRLYPSSDVIYIANGNSHYNYYYPAYIFIADICAAFPNAIRLFELDPTTGKIKHRPEDCLLVRGIHSYIYQVEHERAHKSDYLNQILWHGNDGDGDGLDDGWEQQHGFDPTDPDTANAYGGSIEGDQNASADIQAYGILLTTRELWRQDWAAWDDCLRMCHQHGPPFYFDWQGRLRKKQVPWKYLAWDVIDPNAPDKSYEPPGKAYLKQIP